MQTHVSRRQSVKYLPWILLALAVGYLAVAWLWKRAFIWGDSGGPYWLFIMMDWTVLPLILVNALGFVMVAAVGLVRLSRREPAFRSSALTSGILLLTSLCFLGASFPLLLSLMRPLDSLTVQGRVYHLAGITALMDENYALFACDGYGLLCRQIYRSGDYVFAESVRAQLAYDEATNTLSVAVGARGTIHTYQLEPPSTRGAVIAALPRHPTAAAALTRTPESKSRSKPSRAVKMGAVIAALPRPRTAAAALTRTQRS